MPKNNKGNKRKKTVLNWDQISESERPKVFSKLAAELAKNDLGRVELEATKQISYPSKEVGHELIVGGECAPTKTAELEKYEEFVHSLIGDATFEVNMLLGQGDDAAPAKVFDLEGKEVNILAQGSPEAGKVVLLHFWAKGTDNDVLKKFAAAATAKKAWVGKVRILAVNLNDELENAKDDSLPNTDVWINLWGGPELTDTEEDLTRVQVLYLEATQHLPESVLVNQLGQVVKRGHLTETELEAEIDQLVASPKPVPVKAMRPEDKKKPGSWSLIDPKEQQTIIQEISAEIVGSGLKDLMLMISESQYACGGDTRTESSLMLCGDYEHTQEAGVLKLFAILQKHKVTDCIPMIAVKMPQTAIQLSDSCSECKAAIGEGKVRYYCACCVEPYTICAKCESDRSKFSHPQFHVLFRLSEQNSGKDEHIDPLFRIGDITAFPADKDDIRTEEDVFCNQCKKGPISAPRFKCAHCFEFDLCGECVASGEIKEKKQTKEGEENDEEDDGQNHESWHILAKIENPAGVRLHSGGHLARAALEEDGAEGDEGEDDDDDDAAPDDGTKEDDAE